MQQRMRQQPATPVTRIQPMDPSLAKATSSEMFKCWNCGSEFETDGKNEGACPVCGKTCTRDRCRVGNHSNEGY